MADRDDAAGASSDYKVGYRRPPLHSRFKPGQSGNPSGGKAGPKAPRELLDQLLAETMTVTEQGRRKRVSKLELVMRQLVNRAASGDPRLMRMLLDRLARSAPQEVGLALAPADEAIIAELMAGISVVDSGNDA